MRLYSNCHECKKEIRFSTWESDRVGLSKAKGNKIELTCNYCRKTDYYHVNQIRATESRFAGLTALIIFLIGTPLTIYLTWDYIFQFSYIYIIAGLTGIIGVPITVYSIIEKEQRDKISRFNYFKISE